MPAVRSSYELLKLSALLHMSYMCLTLTKVTVLRFHVSFFLLGMCWSCSKGCQLESFLFVSACCTEMTFFWPNVFLERKCHFVKLKCQFSEVVHMQKEMEKRSTQTSKQKKHSFRHLLICHNFVLKGFRFILEILKGSKPKCCNQAKCLLHPLLILSFFLLLS